MSIKPTIILLIALLYCTAIIAQDAQSLKVYNIERIPSPPVIDGHWDDMAWNGVAIATDFVQLRPVENAPPTFRTEVKMAYDDGAIYIAAFCYDPNPDSILLQLGNRDDGNLNADLFRVSFDPYDQQQDNTSFRVYASGVQSEWKASDNSYNAVWESATQIHENGWSVEMRIPYSALRFPAKDEQQWTMQIKRQIRRYREDVIWSPISKNDDNYMNYWGKLRGFKNISPPPRLSLTPFITVQVGTEPDDDDAREFNWLITGGADIKYGLNESFTLDMTLLPDFSQVQSDNVINNLSAFEQAFDEQRAFFQEGIDLFNKGRLFYSRRIGGDILDADAAEDNLQDGEKIINNPEKSRLLNAFKISGRTKQGAGIGIFNAVEGRSFAKIEDENGNIRKERTDPFTNYNILVLEKNFGSNESIYVINTNVTRTDGYDNANVFGVGFSATAEDNKYRIRGDLSYSIVNNKEADEPNDKGFKYNFELDKIKGKFRFALETGGISDLYDINDLGLNFRTNYMWQEASISYRENDPIWKFNNIGTWVGLYLQQYMPTGAATGLFLNTNHWATLKKSFLSVWCGVEASLIQEKDYFEPRTEDRFFRDYTWAGFYVGFSTDYRKKLALDFNMWQGFTKAYGGYHHHNYRIKPIYRVNNHLTLSHEFRMAIRDKQLGYADEDENELPIFGSRNSDDFTNTFTANYIFKNNLSLGLRARHYWSKVVYDEYFDLSLEGDLLPTTYTDPDKENDESFNSLNIDLLFNWQFAPGSSLSISYKHKILQSSSEIPDNFFENFGEMYSETQTNIISIRALYFLDYVNVKSWVKNGRDKRNSKSSYLPAHLQSS